MSFQPKAAIDEKYLQPDEKILAKTKASDGAELYATNRRVIRYKSNIFVKKVESLTYTHIVSMYLESHSYTWLIAVGILLIFFGYWLGKETESFTIGLICCIIGVIIILVGIFYKPSWYQIRTVGLPESELKHWRTHSIKNKDAVDFTQFVQVQISSRDHLKTPT